MKNRTVITLLAVTMLLGASNAWAIEPYRNTTNIIDSYTITWDDGAEKYAYHWAMTFHGLDDPAYPEPQYMRAWALYGLPGAPVEASLSDGFGIYGEDGTWRSADWQLKSRFDPDAGEGPPQGRPQIVWWQFTGDGATNRVLPGETIKHFVTVFDQALPLFEEPGELTAIHSAIHVQHGAGSTWVNNDLDMSDPGGQDDPPMAEVPEPVSALLLALGVPAVLAARRRRNGSPEQE